MGQSTRNGAKSVFSASSVDARQLMLWFRFQVDQSVGKTAANHAVREGGNVGLLGLDEFDLFLAQLDVDGFTATNDREYTTILKI